MKMKIQIFPRMLRSGFEPRYMVSIPFPTKLLSPYSTEVGEYFEGIIEKV